MSIGYRANAPKNYGDLPIGLGEVYGGHHPFDHLQDGVWLTQQGFTIDHPPYWIVTVCKATEDLEPGQKLHFGACVDPSIPGGRKVQKGQWFLAVHMMFSEVPKVAWVGDIEHAPRFIG